MGDHAADIIIPVAKMKASFAAFAVAFFVALPLHEELTQGYVAGGKNTEVAVQRHYPLLLLHGMGAAYGNSFLPNAAEPLTYLALPQQHQHFFFNKAG